MREWISDAACVGQDSDIFFNEDRTVEALTFCVPCPVKDECSAEAEKTRSVGMWGGETRAHNPIRINWI